MKYDSIQIFFDDPDDNGNYWSGVYYKESGQLYCCIKYGSQEEYEKEKKKQEDKWTAKK